MSSESSVWLYRAYDGIDAGTLSSWWSEGDLLRSITSASPCQEENGKLNHAQVLKFMLSSAFVHPYWNEGKVVARMTIPAGSRVPVITGRGDWRTMTGAKPREQNRLPKNAAAAPKMPNDLKIDNEEDVHKKLGMAPIPGARQIFVPLFKDMWVTKIPPFTQVAFCLTLSEARQPEHPLSQCVERRLGDERMFPHRSGAGNRATRRGS